MTMLGYDLVNFRCISFELRALGAAGTAPKVQGVGGLKLANYRLANSRPAVARGSLVRGFANQHAADSSWWPRAHTSVPKAPSTYAAESRSEVSQEERCRRGYSATLPHCSLAPSQAGILFPTHSLTCRENRPVFHSLNKMPSVWAGP